MKMLQHFLNTVWVTLLTLLMPGATQDKTMKPQNQVPDDVLHREKLQGPFPENNPYLDKPNEVMRRMRWNEEHGWADYS